MRFFNKIVIASFILIISFSIDSFAQELNTDSKKDNCYAIALSPDQYKVVLKRVLVKEAYKKTVEMPPVFKRIKEKVVVQKETSNLEFASEKYYDLNTTSAVKTRTQPKTRSLMNFIPASTAGCNNDCDEEKEEESKTETHIDLRNISSNDLKMKANKLLEREKYEDVIAFGRKEDASMKGDNELTTLEEVEYKTIERDVMVKPAITMEIDVPAEYGMADTKELLSKGGEKLWIPVLCPSKVNEITISQLQLALKVRGHYNAETNGQLDENTRTALKSYQQEKNFPVGQLDKATLESLGFNIEML